MPYGRWEGLPVAVRKSIERQVGTVLDVMVPGAGRNSDFSATLNTATGLVFCKGIADALGDRGAAHRHEADINPRLPPTVAPRLRWRIEVDGWLVLGFDHVPGRHADLTPGSPHLPLVAQAVSILAHDLARCGTTAPELASQWGRLAPWRRLATNVPADLADWTRKHLGLLAEWECRAIESARGNSLVHTDLHSLNILVNDRASIIDWAWSRRGSAATDIAFLVARLVAAGHTPAAAVAWAETIPVWRTMPAGSRTALAVEVWGLWEYLSRSQQRPLWRRITPAAQAVARYHLERTTSASAKRHR